ncbi:MAG TPA: HlyD family efflux transporter periplasmic adaptor subunit [Telluria sp.]|nr:HlyD family efflux transporter periplasmic adaptor subunit [Telluria sp.]
MPISRSALLLGLVAGLAGCGEQSSAFYPGYVEADYVRLASPIAGTLARLHVQRGDQIARGAPAFALEQESERAARLDAQAHLARAQSTLADLRKGRRPDEVAVARAQLAQAQAALRLSQAAIARQEKLLAAHFVSPAQLDELRAAVQRDQGRVHEAQSQVRVARLGARSDELAAAQQDVTSAQAQLAQADWRVEQKSQVAPLAAQVADVLYREGELVAAGMPVVSLLAPGNVRARFFVPQASLGAIALGQDVTLRCDGCKAALAAKVSFIAPEAEYTAPLIYSKENRATLVFMVEARLAPADARTLHPGQPLEVRPAAAAR